MEGSRFDAWTRRRVGLAAGGLGAAAFLAIAPPRGDAKKKKKKCKKIRCRKLLQTCQPSSKEQSCCQGLNCDPVEDQGLVLLCCLGRQQPCQTSSQCCGESICFPISGLTGDRCCGGAGHFCASSNDCCAGATCISNGCAPTP
jgi:hypothetical protein